MRNPSLKPSRQEPSRQPTERTTDPAPLFVQAEPEAIACPVEEIAQAYLTTTHGDADLALRCAITDALSDLMEAERRARENSRLISRGYMRNASLRW